MTCCEHMCDNSIQTELCKKPAASFEDDSRMGLTCTCSHAGHNTRAAVCMQANRGVRAELLTGRLPGGGKGPRGGLSLRDLHAG